MGPWVIPAASAAASAVQSYLASRKQRRGYERICWRPKDTEEEGST
jgi:hypothetical protein